MCFIVELIVLGGSVYGLFCAVGRTDPVDVQYVHCLCWHWHLAVGNCGLFAVVSLAVGTLLWSPICSEFAWIPFVYLERGGIAIHSPPY